VATIAVSVGFGQSPGDGPAGHGTLVSVLVTGSDDQVVVSLVGDRMLSGLPQEIAAPPYRVFVDFESIVPDVDPVTLVGHGGVDQVRVALNQSSPPVTRVVLDLSRRSTYRVEHDPTGSEFRIIVGPEPSASASNTRVEPAEGSRTTDSPPSPVEKHYATWFTRVTQQIESLLLSASPMIHGEESDAIAAASGFDWQTIRHEVELVTAPPSLQEAHDLLLTTVSLGEVGADRNGANATNDDRSAARAGARMLLARALALVNAARDPAAHLERQ
jgi:hypothetical protein